MKSIQKKIKAEFSSTLNRQIRPPDASFRICCAFSGGPDSTALLLLLRDYAREVSCDLEAVYIGHGIRVASETEREEDHIRSLCLSLDIPLYFRAFPSGFLEHYSRLKGCGVESAARTYRYHVFEKHMQQSEIPVFFALGHNRNDQVETVLMRLFSGSSPEGLKGIPGTRENYFRPLIETDRRDIEAFLDEMGVSTVFDSTNGETEYLRNKTRHKVLPAVRESFPACDEAVLGFRSDLADILEHYGSLLQSSCPWSGSLQEGSFTCREKDFLPLPFVSRKTVVLEKINLLCRGAGQGRRIPASFFLPLRLMKGRIILKGHGIILERHKGELRLSPDSEPAPSVYYRIDRDHDFTYSSSHYGRNAIGDAGDDVSALRVGLRLGSDIGEGDTALVLSEPGDTAAADRGSVPGCSATSGDNFLVRTPLGKGEISVFPSSAGTPRLLVFSGSELICGLGSGTFFLPRAGKEKKIEDIMSDCYYLCIIIEGRGHYAPGRQKQ